MIGEALLLLRVRKGLTQTAASKLAGAADYRTLSHWETGRKLPSYALLRSYVTSLGFDFHDLQEALDQVEGKVPKHLRVGLEQLEGRMAEIEKQLGLEAAREAAGCEATATLRAGRGSGAR